MRSSRRIIRQTLALLTVVSALVPALSFAICLTPPGDVSADGETNVIDVQCKILMNLWSLAGQTGPVPTCIKAPGSPAVVADQNCDGILNVSDTLLGVNFALGISLNSFIDANGNQCVDACESDLDGDGDFDLADCAPVDAGISSATPEACNGFDDNCNGQIDEAGPSLVQSCTDSDVCNGEEPCAALPSNLGLMISEIMVAPLAVSDANGEWVELYNPTGLPININGWRLSNEAGQNHLIAPGGALFVPARGFLLLARNSNFSANGGVLANYQYTTVTLPNTAGAVALLDANLNLVDRVAYNSATFPIVPGHSIALSSPAADNLLPGSWQSSTVPLASGDFGTPRGPNRDVQISLCTTGEPLVCDDANVCTDDSCDASAGCITSPNAASCDDGNTCTINDICAGGTCGGGGALDCDDANGCTDDSCDPASGCAHVANTAACDDGDACTESDACANSTCQAGPLADCDDSNECTDDGCDPASGCTAAPNAASCDDGNACTSGDVCSAGTCAGTGVTTCDDGNICTDDACDPAAGCTSTPNSASCDNGDPCTTGDQCAGGVCTPGSPASCDDSVDCTVDSCDPVIGCIQSPSSSLCDDGDICTSDTCTAGGCTHAPVLNGACAPLPDAAFCGAAGQIGDKVRCTLRVARASEQTPEPTALSVAITYDPAQVAAVRFVDTFCLTPDPATCVDADVPPSTLSPTGHSLVPTPSDIGTWNGAGNATVFHLAQPATALTGAYVTLGAVTGDTDLVDLEVELLQATAPGAPSYLYLDEIVGATANATKMVGSVVSGVMVLSVKNCADVPGICNDEDACTADVCHELTGECAHLDTICSDGNACNGEESCDSVAGCLSGTPLNCDDSQICTTDGCDPQIGCTNVDVDCSDGNPCNGSEQCHFAFGCQAGPKPSCDDGNPCTIDSCTAGLGCTYVPSTAETCLPPGLFCGVSGVAGEFVDCPIRLARANLATPAPTSAQFRVTYDGTFAQAVALVDLMCIGAGGGPPCIEAQTPPAVLAPTGHTVVPIPLGLDAWGDGGDVVIFHPGSPTTALNSAYLSAGGVLGQSQLLTLRLELLTNIPASSPAYLGFEDIKGATATAKPMAGWVLGGTMILGLENCTGIPDACNDFDACTTDACIAGNCVHSAIHCNDGNACNGVETCAPNVGCLAGATLACNDGNACTKDACDPTAGCTHTAVQCSDGNACNGLETCDSAVGCVPAAPPNCNDGNACTADSCASALGCIHAPIATPSCLPDGLLCWISGAAGSEAVCTIGAARQATNSPKPASAQISLSFDAASLGAPAFEDLFCTGANGGPPCVPFATPPGGLMPSGHSVSLVPANTASWNGSGTVVLFHAGDPFSALTDAVWAAGAPVGITQVLNVRFTLSTDIPAHLPVGVWITEAKGASGNANALSATVSKGIIVFGPQNCATAPPGACDDGYPCTVDACNTATGQCTHQAKVCSDGNACNGIETCQASTGACLPAFPLNCNDSNACTTDACAPASGCVHQAVACDDGNPCNGMESCNPSSGCAPGESLDCDDGDPCTVDACDTTAGCMHVPDAASGCLPFGALCALAGSAGDTIDCPIRMARANAITPPPASSQFDLHYNPSLAAFAGVFDVTCLGANGGEPCFEQATPDGALYPSGHTVVLVPGATAAWDGDGSVVFFHPSNPATPLTTAVMTATGPVGDAELATVRFSLSAEIPGDAPHYVMLSDIKGATAAAHAMLGTAVQGTLVMALKSCASAPELCDDGNACTVDTCGADGMCHYSGAQCDDGNVCNGSEGCDPATGCTAGVALQCDDANACTTDTCDPDDGCQSSPLVCDDGNACTGVETCESASGCVAGAPLVCNDGEPCTDDACSPALGCTHQPTNCADNNVCNGFESCTPGVGCQAGPALNCDDSDACTTDSCHASGGCQHTPILTAECLPDGALCGLVGPAGTTVQCPIRVARATQPTPQVAGVQFTLDYSPGWLQAEGFRDELCLVPGEPCIELEVPPAALQPSGHTVVALPSDASSWAGTVDAAVFHPATPSAALGNAYVAAGAVQGDAQIMWMELTVLVDIADDDPQYVWASATKGTTGNALAMTGAVWAGTMVFTLPNCNSAPNACDDGKPCTFDTCNAQSGQCSHLALQCSDGNVCTGLETCEPTTGECTSGASLECDDSDACTNDTCAPEYGCQFAAIDCSDGDPCNGVEHCDGGLCGGGTPLDCDDGDSCTLDSCQIGVGCVHAPSLTDECLPAGILCGLTGSAGETVSCELRMARRNAATPDVASAQMQLGYDAGAATPVGFYDTICFGEDCSDLQVPPASLVPSNHVATLVPIQLADWNGSGNLVLFQSPGSPSPLATSYLQFGSIVGDPQILEFRLQLDVDVPATDPLWISASNIVGSTFNALKLTGQASHGVMILTLQKCTSAPNACDDEEPCTTDACVGGNCAHSPVVCTDGSVCNGLETCTWGVGCEAGAALDCDDDDACTVDSCHPTWGCVHALVECDDGDACTGEESCDPASGCVPGTPLDCDDASACTDEWCESDSGCWSVPVICDDGDPCNGWETCDAATGCQPPAAPLDCDDSDECTLDSCETGVGCIHAPSLALPCLPDGACCGVAGDAGDMPTCAIRVARPTEAAPAAASLQATLLYDEARLAVVGFTDEFCFGDPGAPTCVETDVPPGTLAPTGHTVTLVPGGLESWSGSGSLVIFHPSAPSTAISDAFLPADAEAEILDVHVELLTDVPASNPAYLWCSDVKGGTATAVKLQGAAVGGTLVLSPQ